MPGKWASSASNSSRNPRRTGPGLGFLYSSRSSKVAATSITLWFTPRLAARLFALGISPENLPPASPHEDALRPARRCLLCAIPSLFQLHLAVAWRSMGMTVQKPRTSARIPKLMRSCSRCARHRGNQTIATIGDHSDPSKG